MKNILGDADSLFLSSTGSWSVTNGEPVVDASETVTDFSRSLLVKPLVANQPVNFTIQGVTIPITSNGTDLHFHAKVKSLSTCFTTITVARNDGTSFTQNNRTAISRWSVVRSPVVKTPNTLERITFTITVSVCEHKGENVYFALPFFHYAYAFANNQFLMECFYKLPYYMRELDWEHGENYGLPDWPLTRFMDLPTGIVGRVVDDYWAFKYVDVEEGRDPNNPETLSELVDANRSRPEFLLWLAQFLGVTVDSPQASPTVWARLPDIWYLMQQEIDPANNNTYVPVTLVREAGIVTAVVGENFTLPNTWISVRGTSATALSFDGGFKIIEASESALRWEQEGPDETATVLGTIIALDSEWVEIENYDRVRANLTDFLRWQVQFAYNGINGGTQKALIDSIRRELKGEKTANIVYKYQGSPWKILVVTKEDETPLDISPSGDPTEELPDEQKSSAIIQAYIRNVKPIGYQVTHIVTETGNPPE